MRHLLLFAAPLALVACGSEVSQTGGDTMPAPSPIASSDKEKPETKQPEKQITQAAGSWADADATSGERLEFVSEDGETVLVSLTCQKPDAFAGEGAANALVMRRVYSDDEAPNQIGLLTSAGNAAIPAQLDEDAGEVSGVFDTRSQAARALANGAGDLRLVVAQSEYVVPTDERVDALIESCRPPIETSLESEDASDAEDAEMEESEDPATGS